MGIRSVFKRAGYGERLVSMESQGRTSIERLSGLRDVLPALRIEIGNDPDLDQGEKDDAIAEVNAVIVELVTAVKAFADSL